VAQEVLGFGFFVVPLLQLLGTKEADDPLPDRVAVCNNLADDCPARQLPSTLFGSAFSLRTK
jgi:hypothetical protein